MASVSPESFDQRKELFHSYEGQLLLATPSMEGFFENAVIYICAHNASGAMGLVLNRVLDHIDCQDILQQLNIDSSIVVSAPQVYLGGPVETGKGFILHTSEYRQKETISFRNGLALTSNTEILKDVVTGNGPQHSLLTLGYAGWAPGQLEAEIIRDNWLLAPASMDLIFSLPAQQKWLAARACLGINSYNFVDKSGHA